MSEKVKKVEYCKICDSKFIKCRHVAKKTCLCEDTDSNHVILRGYCIFCLFDGTKGFEEKWGSLNEAIVNIGLGIYKLGYAQALKGDRALYLCQSADDSVKGMYELYKAGYEAGSVKNRLDITDKISRIRYM